MRLHAAFWVGRILLVFCLCVFSPQLFMADGDCAAWSIHGYHIGMSEREAGRIRKLKPPGMLWKPVEPLHAFRVKERGRFDGVVFFTADGVLAEYVGIPKGGSRGDLEQLLRQKLGDPLTDDEVATVYQLGTSTREDTIWIDEECKTVLRLGAYSPDGISTIIQVGIERLEQSKERSRCRSDSAKGLID